jgi:hypothetical protein
MAPPRGPGHREPVTTFRTEEEPMNRFRTLVLSAAAALVGLVAPVLSGATTAWAAPAPFEPDRTPPTGGGAAAVAGDGIDLWQVLTIAAASAMLAVVVTLVVLHLAGSRRPSAPRPAPA